MTTPDLPGIQQVLSGLVNAYLVETPAGLLLIDTGYPNSPRKILAALEKLGRKPQDIQHILCTHGHPDHIGGLAEMVRQTGAETWMHEIDAPVAESGEMRPIHPVGGLRSRLLFTFAIAAGRLSGRLETCQIDHRFTDDTPLPFGLRAIHAPGHAAGQVVLYWPERRILFAADSCMNISGLGLSLLNEDTPLARQTFRSLGELDFDIAFFGHGAPILENAAQAFRRAAES